MERLKGRCATCLNWKGDRKNIAEQIPTEQSQLKDFLNFRSTWAGSGHCTAIWAVCSYAEPEGTFGCILWEYCFSEKIK